MATIQETLCAAIASKNLVRFYYAGDTEPGYRTVEPHMVAYNKADNLVLSAWFLVGASESQEGQWWREYLLSDISYITVLPDKFPGPRPGYKPNGGKLFHNIQCALL
jgi:hypothetical protein